MLPVGAATMKHQSSKRQGIPIAANILSKSDSGERLNLKPPGLADNSPLKQQAIKMLLELPNFEKQFQEKKPQIFIPSPQKAKELKQMIS